MTKLGKEVETRTIGFEDSGRGREGRRRVGSVKRLGKKGPGSCRTAKNAGKEGD